MTEPQSQQETLQSISDDWKHRDDAPKPAKTGRSRRSSKTKASASTAAAKDSEPAPSASAAKNKEGAETA